MAEGTSFQNVGGFETGIVRREELVGILVIISDTELTTYFQVLEGVIFCHEVIAQHKLAAIVSTVQAVVIHRVTDHSLVVVVSQVFTYFSVLVVFLEIGIGSCILTETNDRVIGEGFLGCKLVAELQLAYTVGKVDVGTVNRTVGLLHDTVNIVVVKTDTKQEALGTSIEIKLVTVIDTCAQGLRQPIGIHTTCHISQMLLVEVVEFHYHVSRIVGVGVLACHLFELKLLTSVHKVVAAQIGDRYIHGAIVADTQLTGLGLDGFNNDYAVGCLGTVDGGRGGVLKKGHRSNTVNVEVVDSLQRRFETVEDEERLIGVLAQLVTHAQHTRLTTNLYIRHTVRVGTEDIVVKNVKRGIKSLEAGDRVLNTHSLQLFAREGCRRTGKGILTFGHDTGYDHLAHLRVIVVHADNQVIDIVLAVEDIGLVLHSDIGE